jgi:hypothetical protein
MTTKYCWEYHDDCNNPTVIYRYCKPEPPPPPPPEEPDPVCDGGNWDNLGKPSGVYPYCSEIKYSFVAKDADGVNKSTIVVKVNGDVRVNASKNTIKAGDTEVRVKETLTSVSPAFMVFLLAFTLTSPFKQGIQKLESKRLSQRQQTV